VLLRLPSALRRQDGFSFIEILVVMIVLGILAAIVLPTFLGQTGQGSDASAKSDTRSVVDAVEHCSTDGEDYTGCDEEAELGLSGLPWGNGPGKVSVISSAAREYAVRATSDANHEFTWTKRPNGSVERTCAPAGEGGCDSSGSW